MLTFSSSAARPVDTVRPALPVVPSAAAAQPSPLPLDRQLCFALYSASLALTKFYKPLLGALGLTYPQYLVMLALWQRDAVAVSDLGRELRLDSGTLTPLLKRLEAAGLLARRRDTADERRVRLHLTPAGHALKRRSTALPERLACAAGCPPEELAALTVRVQALRDAVLASTTALPDPPDPPDRAAA